MPDDNRARILALAVAAIDAGGEAAIRVNHLVAEAGVTPPVLYYHFGSRDGLVIAAQVERYTRQTTTDLVAIEEAVAHVASRDELRDVMVDIWRRIFAHRRESRWVRLSALGSAYARPEIEAAIGRAQDELVTGLARVFEPFRERGWFRADLDLATVMAWQHGVVFSRAFVERGGQEVDLDEWDRMSIEALLVAFFGP